MESKKLDKYEVTKDSVIQEDCFVLKPSRDIAALYAVICYRNNCNEELGAKLDSLISDGIDKIILKNEHSDQGELNCVTVNINSLNMEIRSHMQNNLSKIQKQKISEAKNKTKK